MNLLVHCVAAFAYAVISQRGIGACNLYRGLLFIYSFIYLFGAGWLQRHCNVVFFYSQKSCFRLNRLLELQLLCLHLLSALGVQRNIVII